MPADRLEFDEEHGPWWLSTIERITAVADDRGRLRRISIDRGRDWSHTFTFRDFDAIPPIQAPVGVHHEVRGTATLDITLDEPLNGDRTLGRRIARELEAEPHVADLRFPTPEERLRELREMGLSPSELPDLYQELHAVLVPGADADALVDRYRPRDGYSDVLVSWAFAVEPVQR